MARRRAPKALVWRPRSELAIFPAELLSNDTHTCMELARCVGWRRWGELLIVEPVIVVLYLGRIFSSTHAGRLV